MQVMLAAVLRVNKENDTLGTRPLYISNVLIVPNVEAISTLSLNVYIYIYTNK